MFEAFIPALTAIVNTLVAYRDVVYEPSKKNLKNLLVCLEEMEEAYIRFDFQMSKASTQLQLGQIDNLREEMAKLNNPIAENLATVIAKGKQIARELALLGNTKQVESARKLLAMGEYIKELWNSLNRAIIDHDARHIKGFFDHFRVEVREYFRSIDKLVSTDAVDIVKKLALSNEVESANSHEEEVKKSLESFGHPPSWQDSSDQQDHLRHLLGGLSAGDHFNINKD